MARIASLILSLALLSIAVAVPATVERQVGFTFDASDPTPTPAAEGADDATAAAAPAVTATEPTPTPDAAAADTTTAADADVSSMMTTTTTTTVTDPISMTAPTIAYNCGGLTAEGVFLADPTDYVIGDTITFDLPESNIIANATTEPYKGIYESHRHGNNGATWGYDLPVTTAGTYECTLHFAETYDQFFTEESNRELKVMIAGNGPGTTVQSATFDVMVELGGAEFTPYTRTFAGLSVTDTIMIRLEKMEGTNGDAFMSGVSCAMTS